MSPCHILLPAWPWRALVLLLCAAACLPRAGAQPGCDPSLMCCADLGSGSTCGGGGVATQGNVSGLDEGVGNPIHLLSGNKFQREVDLPPLPGVLGLELVRYYNSSDTRRGLLGRGWRLSYETELRERPGGLEIVQADGTRLFFGPADARSGVHRARLPLQGLVQRLPGARGTEHLWRWADGRELRFNTRGQLEQIRVPSGEFLSLRYDGRGPLHEVIDPAQRRLVLHHLDPDSARSGERYRGVQSIDTPVGRYRYEHGGGLPPGSAADPGEVIANLVSVRYPEPAAGATGPVVLGRQYHHEDPRFPTLLTGISVQGRVGTGAPRSERISRWAYDASRRAVLSASGERTGSGGALQQVSLHWPAGQQGRGEALVRDGLGRETVYSTGKVAGAQRILQVRGPGCTACGPGGLRYGYDALGRLVEQTTLDQRGEPLLTRRTERDDQGRPVLVSDTEYRAGRPQPVRWRARYAYASVDARDPLALPDPQPVFIATPSVLPGRERSTRLAYNAARQLVSVSEQGFAPVDGEGRPSPQGTPLRRSTVWTYAQLNGRSVAVSRDGPLPNGPHNSPEDSDVMRLQWDAGADRLQSVVWPGGRAMQVSHRPDAERLGSVLAAAGRAGQTPADTKTGTHAAEGPMAEPLVQHDAWARPVAWHAGEGGAVLQAAWGPSGNAAEHSVLMLGTVHAQALRLIDDFGRVVAIRNPGQGWQHARHDEADRPVLITDPRGARQRLHWDAAGQLGLMERWAPGDSRVQQRVQRRYESERLVEERVSDGHGVRSTRYVYDAQGSLKSETLSIEPSGTLAQAMPRPVSLSLSYLHGEGGAVLGRLLTDATGRTFSVAQELDEQGQVARISTGGVLPRWLGGRRELLRALEWQALGELSYATRITHGDGSVDAFEGLPRAQAAGLLRTTLRPAAAAAVGPASRAGSPGWGLDAAGLPAFIWTASGLQGLRWNAAGQLVQSQREDGRSEYLYDARGRRVLTLVWDAQGRPRAQLSLYEDHRLIGEADAEGRWSHAYVHLGYRPVAQMRLPTGRGWPALRAWLFGPDVRHLHTARAGRVQSMSDRGRIVWQDGLAPDARVRVHQPLRYVGQYHDKESGLDYHGARFFDPGSGRFISPDPTGVADAVNGLAPSLLLDLYAYAGGRPDEYFDPDGAARIRYFAITSNSQGNPIGTTQGFVKARWAFIVDQVGAGGDKSALGQKQNEYAAAGTSLLFDRAGSYLEKGRASAVWGGPEAGVEQDFMAHYRGQLISIEQFEIQMDDADAAALIASYIEKDKAQVFDGVCPVRETLLPPIRFSSGEADIHVDRQIEPPANGSRHKQANVQRILNCQRPTTMPVRYSSDEERRRIAKYEAAAELQESPPTSAIYKDCSSNNGCRSRTAITINGNRYFASYGRTQFVVETFLTALRQQSAGMTAEQLSQLQLDKAMTLPDGSAGTMLDLLRIARDRATAAANEFKELRSPVTGFGLGLSPQQAVAAWDSMTPRRRDDFRRRTGLDRSEFVDMLTFVPDGRARTNAEAQNAFGSEAAMRLLDGDGQASFGEWLLWLYSSQDEYNFVSEMFLKTNLSTVLDATALAGQFVNAEPTGSEAHRQRQRAIEEDLVQRVAAMHNWGSTARVTASVMRLPTWVRAYVDEFMSVAGRGDFGSLRCSDDLGGLTGLQMQTLSLK